MKIGRISRYVLVGLLAFCGGATSAFEVEPAGFSSEIAPFFKQHCVRCLGAERPKAGFALHAIDADLANGSDIESYSGHREIGNLYATLLHTIGDRRDYFGQRDPMLRGEAKGDGPLVELVA